MEENTNTNEDGLRVVLPDVCRQHTEYRVYCNGQYVESVGHLGRDAQQALDFWREARLLVPVRNGANGAGSPEPVVVRFA
jgi:hypothetical protein